MVGTSFQFLDTCSHTICNVFKQAEVQQCTNSVRHRNRDFAGHGKPCEVVSQHWTKHTERLMKAVAIACKVRIKLLAVRTPLLVAKNR